MNRDINPMAVGLVVLFIGFILYNTGPIQTIDGQNVVPTKVNFNLWRSKGEADASFSVYDRQGAHLGDFNVLDNQLYQDPEQEKSGPITIRATHNFFGGDPTFDVGSLGAYHKGLEEDKFQVGLRYSPFRFAFNAIAADFAVTQDSAGVGLSFYLPTKGRWYSKFGLGAWYLFPYDNGNPAIAYGISFSIK